MVQYPFYSGNIVCISLSALVLLLSRHLHVQVDPILKHRHVRVNFFLQGPSCSSSLFTRHLASNASDRSEMQTGLIRPVDFLHR